MAADTPPDDPVAQNEAVADESDVDSPRPGDEGFEEHTPACSTVSLTPSVLDFPEEDGRTYHAFRQGRYLVPNDEKECDRLDMLHALVTQLVGRLYVSPIGESPQRVLDVGTGTGIWAIDFADIHPSAEVIGCDLSPIQPDRVPPNLQFIVDDAEEDWDYESEPFDFVHCRHMTCAIRDMQRLVQQSYNCTKPGGWVEFQDWDNTIHDMDGSLAGTNIADWCHTTTQAFHDLGYHASMGPEFYYMLLQAGFSNITMNEFHIPLGAWPRDQYQRLIGAVNAAQVMEMLEGSSLAVLTRIGWSKAAIYALCAGARADLRNRDIHGLFSYVFTAQKPEFQ